MTTKYGLSGTALEGWRWQVESKIRYHAKRRGYYVMLPRGFELKRREKAGVGPYMLLNMATDTVELPAATLTEIADFLRHNDRAQQYRH